MLLAVVNVFNYMDRMLLAVLLPDIQSDLDLSDTQLGLLTGLAFALFYALAGIPIARLADRWVRTRLITLSLVAWSGMTALCGAAHSFWQLAAARVGVGVGEAGCVPASQSIISDYVPARQRPAALAVHLAGASIGILIGMALGGMLAQAVGWRTTFVVMGLAGLPLALLVHFTLKEPPRGHADGASSSVRLPSLGEAVRELWARRSFVHLVLVYGIANLSTFGINQWAPTYYSRHFGLSMGQIGLMLGVALGAGMTIGALGGGFIANKLMRRDLRWGAWLCMAAAATAVPVTALTFVAPSYEIAIGATFVSAVLSGSTAGPITALVQSVASPRVRALAAAVTVFAASLVGMGGGPLLIGMLSDALRPSFQADGLRIALLVASFVPLWAVAQLGLASRWLVRDVAAASGHRV